MERKTRSKGHLFGQVAGRCRGWSVFEEMYLTRNPILTIPAPTLLVCSQTVPTLTQRRRRFGTLASYTATVTNWGLILGCSGLLLPERNKKEAEEEKSAGGWGRRERGRAQERRERSILHTLTLPTFVGKGREKMSITFSPSLHHFLWWFLSPAPAPAGVVEEDF